MPVRTPHFPDLHFGAAARLRRWEDALMGLLATHGYRELHPSLVLREPAPEGALRFFDGDDHAIVDGVSVASGTACNGTFKWSQVHDPNNAHNATFFWQTRSKLVEGGLLTILPSG